MANEDMYGESPAVDQVNPTMPMVQASSSPNCAHTEILSSIYSRPSSAVKPTTPSVSRLLDFVAWLVAASQAADNLDPNKARAVTGKFLADELPAVAAGVSHHQVSCSYCTQ